MLPILPPSGGTMEHNLSAQNQLIEKSIGFTFPFLWLFKKQLQIGFSVKWKPSCLREQNTWEFSVRLLWLVQQQWAQLAFSLQKHMLFHSETDSNSLRAKRDKLDRFLPARQLAAHSQSRCVWPTSTFQSKLIKRPNRPRKSCL